MNDETRVRIRRTMEDPFTRVPKTIAQRDGLGMEATAVLTYLLSFADDWEVRIKDLTRRFPDGVRAVQRAFKELESLGYAKLVSIKEDGSGAWLGKRWTITDDPNRAHNDKNALCENVVVKVVPTLHKNKSAIPPGGASRNNRPLSSRKAVPNGGFDLRLDGLPNTTAGRMCADYNDFLTKHRLHPAITRNGHTHTIKPKYKNWISAIEFLLDQKKTDVVREVMEWYFDNYAEDVYLPRCCALTTFVKSFEKIERAMYRQQHRTPEPKEEYQVEITRTRRFE